MFSSIDVNEEFLLKENKSKKDEILKVSKIKKTDCPKWEANLKWCINTIPTLKVLVEKQKQVYENLENESKLPNYNKCVEIYEQIEEFESKLNATKTIKEKEEELVVDGHFETNFAPIPFISTSTYVDDSHYETVEQEKTVADEDTRRKVRGNLERLNKLKQKMPNYNKNIKQYLNIKYKLFIYNQLKQRLDECDYRKKLSMAKIATVKAVEKIKANKYCVKKVLKDWQNECSEFFSTKKIEYDDPLKHESYNDNIGVDISNQSWHSDFLKNPFMLDIDELEK